MLKLANTDKNKIARYHYINQDLGHKFLFNCENYYYTLLPDGTKEYSSDVSYGFDNIGEFTFDVYLKNNSHKKYIVKITSIDNSGPIGTCSLYHDNNKTGPVA